jgi:suppressor of tumorigenicity protein 13
MGDSSKPVNDEEMEQANDLLSEARGDARDKNYSEAIQKLTKAITLNPAQSNLYAFRAEYLVAQKKPNAAIRDANRALELNPDSSRALKTRGKAKRYLGKYLEAFYDLSQGNSLDWDESTPELIKEISERAEKAKQRQRKEDEKHRLDQLKRDAAEKRRRQQEEEDRQQQQQQPQQHGAGPGGINQDFINEIFKDPEIQSLFKNNPGLIQKVVKAFSGDMTAAQDPDVQKVFAKMQASYGAHEGQPHAEHSHAEHSHAEHSHAEHSHAEHSHAEHSHPEHSHPGHSHTTHSKPNTDDDLD